MLRVYYFGSEMRSYTVLTSIEDERDTLVLSFH